MRRIAALVLVVAIHSTLFGQEQQQEPTTPAQTAHAQVSPAGNASKPSDTEQGPVTPSQEKAHPNRQVSGEGPSVPAPVVTMRQTSKSWYKRGNNWLIIGSVAGIGATGGYLLPGGGTGRKIGGGALIGLDGLILCEIFVRGCAR